MDDKVKSLQDFVNALSAKVTAIEEEIGIIASGGFMPAGSVYFADLPSLDEHRYGYVYNIKDAFTTTSDFIEGAGKSYPAGADVGIIHDDLGQLKYDVLAGFIDTSAIYSAIDEKQSKELSKGIAGETTVEGALEAIAAGSSVTVDTALDITSTNAVQNKVIKAALDGKLDADGKAASAASADFATKATNDGHDNNIANTYATKTELGNAVVANPSDVASTELTKLKVGSDIYSIPQGGSGSGGHSIKDNGTVMTDRSGLNFIDHDLTDDSSGNETKVKPHRFTKAEMEEICYPLPDAPTVVGNVRMSKLWENANLTSNFDAQRITLTSDDYDLLLLIALNVKTTASEPHRKALSVISPKGHGFMLSWVAYGNSQVYVRIRQFDYVDDTHIDVGNNLQNGTNNNGDAVPYQIYGIKFV